MEAVVRNARTRLVAVLTTGMLAIGLAAAPAASAQQQGLVNVDIDNVANDNQVAVTVPINAAANICGVSVNALNAAFAPIGNQAFTCDARANQRVTVSER